MMMNDGGMTLGRGHSTPIDNYKRGARVWHRHPELVWIAGELQQDVSFSSTSIRILLDDGETVEYPLKSPDQLPFLRNPEILIGADDLTTLSYLHEPAVLHNVAFRFVEKEAVYTYCGIVLVAVNPYADCRDLYGDEMIQVYRGVGKQVRGLNPHIYAVAEEAFYDLAEYGKSQSVIVSGESGAGKTVSAKYVMRYFASVAGSRKGGPGIEQRVLASNPIMEAIGNAKTIRNDNSSRFGKYIQLNFGDRYAISGAEMRTYLLEKSRLVFQAANERNYHIFYQMCAARDHPLLQSMGLGSADDYFYTGQGRSSLLEGVDDREEFGETVKALTEVGFSLDAQRHLLKVLAGVLMLGNVAFSAGGGDDATAVTREAGDAVRSLCSDLYGIDESSLRLWLTNREIRTVREVVRKPLNKEEASRNRDALAKMIYAHTFNWVVEKVNGALRGTFSSSPTKGSGAPKPQRFIGVLDIYGFETFACNSFEQFCINYANEKLQQQFNQHVFKLEQEEYMREEIAWVRIDFYDNQPCIDLIEARPGLINYLDEQCKVVKGSDPGWLDQITNCPTLKKSAQLQLPKIRSASFMIKHFAADVSYSVDGFLEKNKDTVNEQLLAVVAATKFPLLREILEPSVGELAQAAAAGGKRTKKTVASQFRDSLKDLMTVLESTRPHYVRCIKPNDEKMGFTFDPKRAIQQLRACGLLETVRISAAGYPSRWNYDDFGKRYRVLYPEGRAMWRDAPRQFASAACTKHLEEGKFALGKTKMFFRTGQVALLERRRIETLKACALKIQTVWRGYVARKRYQTIRHSAKLIQVAGRAFLAYRAAKYLQMHRATIAIQTAWRRYAAEKRYKQMRKAAIAIQAAKENSYGESKLIECAREGKLKEVKRLVEQGSDVNRADPAGWTPLSEAVGANHFEMVKYLLTKNADPNPQSKDGWKDLPFQGKITPLMEACTNGFHEIAKWLLQHPKAKEMVCTTNLDGWSPADFLADYIKRASQGGEAKIQRTLGECEKILERIKQLQRQHGFPVRTGDPPLVHRRTDDTSKFAAEKEATRRAAGDYQEAGNVVKRESGREKLFTLREGFEKCDMEGCGLSYPIADKLLHRRNCKGEKPFACPYCDFTFFQRWSMNRHIKLLSGDGSHGAKLFGPAKKRGPKFGNAEAKEVEKEKKEKEKKESGNTRKQKKAAENSQSEAGTPVRQSTAERREESRESRGIRGGGGGRDVMSAVQSPLRGTSLAQSPPLSLSSASSLATTAVKVVIVRQEGEPETLPLTKASSNKPIAELPKQIERLRRAIDGGACSWTFNGDPLDASVMTLGDLADLYAVKVVEVECRVRRTLRGEFEKRCDPSDLPSVASISDSLAKLDANRPPKLELRNEPNCTEETRLALWSTISEYTIEKTAEDGKWRADDVIVEQFRDVPSLALRSFIRMRPRAGLSLRFCGLDDAKLEEMTEELESSGDARLATLDLSFNHSIVDCEQLAKTITQFRGINTLILQGLSGIEEGRQLMQTVGGMSLNTLVLDENPWLDDECMGELMRGEAVGKLSVLKIAKVSIRSMTWMKDAEEKLPSLKSLTLAENNGIAASGWERVAAFVRSSPIKSIDVRGTAIRPSFLKSLTARSSASSSLIVTATRCVHITPTEILRVFSPLLNGPAVNLKLHIEKEKVDKVSASSRPLASLFLK